MTSSNSHFASLLCCLVSDAPGIGGNCLFNIYHERHVPVLGERTYNGPGIEFVCSPYHIFIFGFVELI